MLTPEPPWMLTPSWKLLSCPLPGNGRTGVLHACSASLLGNTKQPLTHAATWMNCKCQMKEARFERRRTNVVLFTWCSRKRQDCWNKKHQWLPGAGGGEEIGEKVPEHTHTCTHAHPCTHVRTHAPGELRQRARLWGSSLTPKRFQGTLVQEKMWADCCESVGTLVFTHFKLCPLACSSHRLLAVGRGSGCACCPLTITAHASLSGVSSSRMRSGFVGTLGGFCLPEVVWSFWWPSP